MRIVILGLILMAACAAGFGLCVFKLRAEEKLEKKRRECARMCRESVRTGVCPKVCDICAWGRYEH
jgi:hypothetical protein